MFNKEDFIRGLINELNEESERMGKGSLNVPFMVSAIEQHIDKFTEFVDDLSNKNYYFNGYENDKDGYSNGKIRILLSSIEENEDYYFNYLDYVYWIEFNYEDRMWGYCDCSESDKGYNESYKCCGHGCDWSAPSFRIIKEIIIGGASWDGDESDYWEYKNKFNQNELNKKIEVEERLKLEQLERLKTQKLELELKIKELETT